MDESFSAEFPTLSDRCEPFSARHGINTEKPGLFQEDLTRQDKRNWEREEERERERSSDTLRSSFLHGTPILIRFRYPGSTHVNPRSRVASPRVNVIGAPTGKLANRAESSRASETFCRATYAHASQFFLHASFVRRCSLCLVTLAARVSLKSRKNCTKLSNKVLPTFAEWSLKISIYRT